MRNESRVRRFERFLCAEHDFASVAPKMFMRKIIIVTVLLGFAVAHSYAGIYATCHALANLQGAARPTSAFGVYSERLAATQNNCDSQGVCALASTAAAPAPAEIVVAIGARTAPAALSRG